MAKVLMTQSTDDAYLQQSWQFVYEYTYCDQCGSFDLGFVTKLPRLADWLITIAFLFVFTVASVFLAVLTAKWILGLPIALFGLITLLFYRVKTTQFVCHKCGITRFLPENVLNYTPNDFSVIDVPETKVFKKHIESKIV